MNSTKRLNGKTLETEEFIELDISELAQVAGGVAPAPPESVIIKHEGGYHGR